MSSRKRQFSDVRSQTGSRCVSQISDTVSIIDRLSFQSYNKQSKDCIGCFNKNLATSRREEQKRRKQQQNKQHAENIKKVQSKRDHQRQYREKMSKQASEYNKSLAASQRESMKNLKKIEDSQAIEQIKKKQHQLNKANQELKKSRIQRKEKYNEQLKKQLYTQRSQKQLQLSQSRMSEISSSTTNIKLTQQSERYLNKMKEETKKCQQANKGLMLQKSYKKLEEREENVHKQKEHIDRIQKQFSKFTEFQQSSNKQSRSILSSSSITQNPEDIFTEMKRIQNEKKQAMLAQRRQKHTQRMMELKRIQQENRAKIHKKINNMKTYVQQLTHQVREKKQRKAKETHNQKHYQPKKSRVDYFTEQIGKQSSACGSCERVVDKKLITHKN